jgi:uncharacterized protein (DUF433 family)
MCGESIYFDEHISKQGVLGRHVAMKWDRITRDSKVMNGQPCIKGTRLTVSRVLSALAAYPDHAELFRNYPELDEEAIRQSLAYASAAVEDRVIELAETP